MTKNKYILYIIIFLLMLGAVACSVFFGYLINQIPSLNDLPIFRDLPIFNKKNIFLTTITTTLLLGLIGLSLTASIEKIQKLIQDQSTYNSENKLDLGRRMRIIKTHLDNVEKRLKDIVLIHISVSDVGELLGENRSPLEVLKQAEVVKLSETVFKRVVRWITFDKKREKIFEKQVQMIEVFRHEEINGRLLIVGSAGSGKTTMLLKLAKELLIEAKSSESKTIPHVFELSGWVTGQSLCKYLAGELKRIHNLDESIGIVLLESGKILPLLDGLDELRDLGRIREGMREINSFLADSHGNRKIVVCCRIKDYELAQQQLEKLNGAVQLQSLTDDDIKMYLTLLGKNNLWQVIEHNPMLLNGTDTENMMPPLLRTPLFLSIFTEVYQAGKINSVADLWNSYIKKQLEIPANNLPTKGYKRYEPREIPSNKQIQYYLVFLAKQLVGSKPEFLIEEIQPVWLLDNRKKLKMQLILSIVLGVVWGAAWGVSWGIFLGLSWGITSGLIAGLIWGTIWGIILGLNKVEPVEEIQLPKSIQAIKEIFNNLLSGLTWGFISGLFSGFIGSLFFGRTWVIFWCLGWGLIGGFIWGLVEGCKQTLKIRSEPNQGIKSSAKNVVILMPTSLLIWGVFQTKLMLYLQGAMNIEQIQKFPFVISISMVPIVFLYGGGHACIKHLAIRLVLFSCFQKSNEPETRCIPWNYARFLSYAADRRLLQQTGGSYRFIHRSLLEHFSKTDPG